MKSIDTPFGPYDPQVPGPDALARASAAMGDAVEAVARLNHDVWAARRIAEGWRYGPRRDDEARLHPDLVAYEHLPDSEKAYDRETARVVVAELLRRGLLRAG
ncbi:MAG: RyR domain-containing protein [Sterolibacteriaceae bacterium MAG5]|nr:RyR domain-containing protein [Candidatus Nitricoxidireducens bremensis]